MEPVGELAAKPPSCHSVPTVPNGAESGDLIVGDVLDLELAGVVVAQNQVGGAPTRTFSTRCVTANLRRIDLRTSGDNRLRGRRNFLHLRRSLQHWVGPMAPICEWRFVGVAATSIGHRFLPKSWSPYSRM